MFAIDGSPHGPTREGIAPMTSATSATAARRHPLYARFHARVAPLMGRGLAAHRHALLDGLSGRVIEAGAGTGSNFIRYPGEVTAVLAVAPEAHLRRLAGDAAA